MYRGFAQNKNTLFYRAFNAKPRLVAGIGFPLLSTEIICRSGFCPGICSNFPSQPIQHIFRQLIYNTKSRLSCQAFESNFSKIFRFFSSKRNISLLRGIFRPKKRAFPFRLSPFFRFIIHDRIILKYVKFRTCANNINVSSFSSPKSSGFTRRLALNYFLIYQTQSGTDFFIFSASFLAEKKSMRINLPFFVSSAQRK